MKLTSILRKSLKAGTALVALASTTALTAPSAMAQDTGKPNILFVMTDDVGFMSPSIYHQGLMVGETPNIDRIGREGMRFMEAYSEQSCTAGRNAFMTGMNPLRTGLIVPQLPGSPSWLRAGTPTVAKVLRDLGYTTFQVGKNHLGDNVEALQTAHGFEEYWGYRRDPAVRREVATGNDGRGDLLMLGPAARAPRFWRPI